MLSPLDRMNSRILFVVGKGGVGKSTCATALALALARRKERVHLVSTDPAHSLSDILEEPVPSDTPSTSSCSSHLVVEEFHARRRAAAWLEEVSEPLLELVELGSYLDRDDVRPFSEVALPGADEFMVAIRLTELGNMEGLDRVVVDTAPTGHTLRLLDSGGLLESWAIAFEAMAAKAAAVGEGLVGKSMRFRGEEVVAELRRRIRAFEGEILAAANFVVVTRGAPVVREETERLIEDLRDRGLRVAAVWAVGGGKGEGPGEGAGEGEGDGEGRGDEGPVASTLEADPPWISIPWIESPRGCEGLARLAEGLAARSAIVEPRLPGRTPIPPSTNSPHLNSGTNTPPTDPRALLRRGLLFFTGKGGVGKTTCAAAAALALSRDEAVVLIGLDPAGSLGEVLGDEDPGSGAILPGNPVPPTSAARRTPPSPGFSPRLRVRQLDAVGDFEAFRERYSGGIRGLFKEMGLDEAARLDRRVLEAFLGLAPPGIDEIFGLQAIIEECGRAGVVVADTPPTGHFLSLLASVASVQQWVHGALKIVLRYRATVALGDAVEELIALSRNLRALREMLSDPERCGVVIVTLDTPVVARESARLRAALEEQGVPFLATLQNMAEGRAQGPEWRAGRPLIRAPFRREAPVGAPALEDFFWEWEVVA